jgi:hypothetical protein
MIIPDSRLLKIHFNSISYLSKGLSGSNSAHIELHHETRMLSNVEGRDVDRILDIIGFDCPAVHRTGLTG